MTRNAVATRPSSASFDDIFDGFVRTATPVVLHAAALDWPARTRWTPRFLTERYGDAPVELVRVTTGERVKRRLADYFAIDAEERSEWYLADWEFRQEHPELLEDIVVPEVFALDWMMAVPEPRRPDLFWIYIGHAGTRGRTHIDNFGTSAWLAVLQGTKRVVFPTPRDGESLCGVDFFAGAPDTHEVAEAVLAPGDILFVPAGRWHAASNDTYCLSVTANFVDGANFIDHRLFATRHWYGHEMLEQAWSRWRALPAGAERHVVGRHLALALERYRSALARDTAAVERIAASLRSGTVS